ncbi:MAG: carboxylesterase family protein [Gammaproteobacteria bacterium]|nr:carboxylesterase family protein [Gammaproteobacteria bacterium]
MAVLALAALALNASAVTAAQAAAPVDCTAGTAVKTADGPVCGIETDGVVHYLGLPYAVPPVGALRWAAPQPVKPWRPEIKATVPAATCAAAGGRSGIGGSEDCLYLNVQVPAGTKAGDRLPVMAEIHGGGFLVTAFGSLPDTTPMAKHVVLVNIEYRTGVMGFFTAAALGAHSGNYGIQDQQAALRWVQRNIASFGGDPGNVTIIGTSAGGASVCIHAISPDSRGLFHKGISRSGFYNAAVSKDRIWQLADCKSQLLGEQEAQATGAQLIAKVGCAEAQDVAACLRGLPAEKLIGSASSALSPGSAGSIAPIVDGTTIPMSPGKAFREGRINPISLIIGVNRDEINGGVTPPSVVAYSDEDYGRLLKEKYGILAERVMQIYPLERFPKPAGFLAYRTAVADADSVCPALAAFRHLSKYIPVYAYQIDDAAAPLSFLSKEWPWGSFHGTGSSIIEIPMEKGLAETSNRAALIAQVRNAELGYLRTGNPTAPGAPYWPRYTNEQPNVLSLRQAADSVLMPASVYAQQHHCDFWDAVTLEPAH